MELKKPRYVLGIDPSGSFNEGKGHTGFSIFDREQELFIKVAQLEAVNFKTQTEYWHAHITQIAIVKETYKDVAFSMESFILYHATAMSLVNSEMETCQLIGIIKDYCYMHKLPLYMRPAVMVKRRWDEPVMEHRGVIYKHGKNYGVYNTDCMYATAHILDSMKHALHCAYFELKEDNKC